MIDWTFYIGDDNINDNSKLFQFLLDTRLTEENEDKPHFEADVEKLFEEIKNTNSSWECELEEAPYRIESSQNNPPIMGSSTRVSSDCSAFDYNQKSIDDNQKRHNALFHSSELQETFLKSHAFNTKHPNSINNILSYNATNMFLETPKMCSNGKKSQNASSSMKDDDEKIFECTMHDSLERLYKAMKWSGQTRYLLGSIESKNRSDYARYLLLKYSK